MATALKNVPTALLNYLKKYIANPSASVSFITDAQLTVLSYFYQYRFTSVFSDLQMYTGIKARVLKDKDGHPMLDQIAINAEDLDFIINKIKEAVGLIFKVVSPYSTSGYGVLLYDEGINIPTYNTARSEPGDIRSAADGKTYVCILAGDAETPSGGANANWQQLTTDYIAPAWAATTNKPGDIRKDSDGKVYMCTASTTTGEPSSTPASWSLLPQADTQGCVSILLSNTNFDDNVMKVLDVDIKSCILDYCLSEWFKIMEMPAQYTLYAQYFVKDLDQLKFKLNHRNVKTSRTTVLT